jgi:hypothetical protein
MSEKFKDVYLVVTHYQRPAPGEHTHIKDWKKTGKWQVFEEATVTDSLKTKLSASASVIINVTKSKVEKNRFGAEPNSDDKTVFINYMQKFSEHVVKFYAKFRPEILNEMIEQKKQAELNKKIKDMGDEQSKVAEETKITNVEEVPVETVQEAT